MMNEHKNLFRQKQSKYITTAEVRQILRYSDSTLRRWRLELDTFPKPVRISPSPAAPMLWVESDLLEWLEARAEGQS